MGDILVWLAAAMAMLSLAFAASDTIDEFIEVELPRSGAPGLAYAIVAEGTITSKGYGERRAGSGEPVSRDTPFAIGSISKSFTAMGVLILVEAGTVDLDQGLGRYLSEFAARPAGEITIRQLLSHTSGYSTLQGNDILTDQTGELDALSRQVHRIASWPPAYAPGTHWEYSNANYLILGSLIEEMSGMDYARFIETQILEPIGMGNSFVADGQAHENMAVGHQPWFGTKRPIKKRETDLVTAPTGGIIATASDLARYLTVMLNNADDVISAENKRLMLTPANATSPFYGLGWYIDRENGTAYHGGLTPGFETLASLKPSEGIGAVVLVNGNSGMGYGGTYRLLHGITAIGFGEQPPETSHGWGPGSLLLMFAFLPLFFSAAALWAVWHPAALRRKSGVFGAFSLWFPLFVSLALAWTTILLIPNLFGVSLRTLNLYQPDFSLLLLATAVTAVLWAVVRLGIAYSGGKSSASST